MSIKVKRIVMSSPRAFQVFNEYFLNGDAYIEASPIYTSLEVSVDISGTYTGDFNIYSYSYSGSKTFTRAPIVGDSAAAWDPIPAISINGIIEQPTGSVSAVAGVDADEFMMGLHPALDMNPTAYPMYVPAKPAGLFLPSSRTIETAAVIGTRTNSATLETTDIVENVSTTMPRFTVLGTFPTTPRFLIDGFRLSAGGGERRATVEESASGWAASKWRDFRGSYSVSETDDDGVTVEVTLVIS